MSRQIFRQLIQPLVVLVCLMPLFACGLQAAEAESSNDEQWAIALHGGAGSLPRSMGEEQKKKYADSLARALEVGCKILRAGGSALDAVEATVVALENAPLFNAGKGAAFNREGQHELDASIMDGSSLQCGGVGIVRKLKNPIRAARLVMEKTPHVLLAAEGAESFAKQHQCEFVEQSYFYTESRFKKLQEKMESLQLPCPNGPGYQLSATKQSLPEDTPVSNVGGTVGCVALDAQGKLAAATSTGGLTGKIPGRVGDSPINGAGNYANSFVAVSGTGKGEQFIRHTVAARVAWLVESGKFDVDQAVQHCLNNVLNPGDGGLIAVDKKGTLSLHSTTKTLPHGVADSSGRFEVGIWVDSE